MGRKPLIYLPIFGLCISSIFSLLHVQLFDLLPIEFLYLENFYQYFGGSSLYYLGVYGYAADVTSEEERAARMAAFDGVEMLGQIAGKFISPRLSDISYLDYVHVLHRLHAWGSDFAVITFATFLNLSALLYLTFAVRESKKNSLRGTRTGMVNKPSN